MTGIVFEQFTAPITGAGVLPRLRGLALSGVAGSALGFGRLPAFRNGAHGQATYRGLGSASLPRVVGRAVDRGRTIGWGVLPRVTGYARQTVGFDNAAAIQLASLPAFRALAGGHTEYPGAQSHGALPRWRSVAFAQGATVGRGRLPRVLGVAVQAPQLTSFLLLIQSEGVMLIDASGVPVQRLSAGFVVGAAPEATWVQVLLETVRLAALGVPAFDAHVTVAERLALADGLAAVVRMALADEFIAADDAAGWLGIAVALRDALRLWAPLDASYSARAALVATFALRELLRDAQRGMRVDGVDLVDALAAHVDALNRCLDALEIQAVASQGAILFALVADTAAFADARTAYYAITQALLDGAQFGLTLYNGEDAYTAWVMTTETRAMRRYLNYPFNSFAVLDGHVYGAGPDGIYLLEGGDDAGVPIRSAVRTGLLDFGTRQLKRMDRAYLGYAADGTLCLRVINTSETGTKVACTYQMVPTTAEAPREQRVQIGRGLQSVYWQFELRNDATGDDFELHDMTLLPMVLSRRVRG